MKKSNNIGINSVERSEPQKQKWRPYHRDQEKFYELHPPKSTDEWKILKYLFDRRTNIEREKSELETKMKNLERQFDDSFRHLHRMKKGPPISYFLIHWWISDAIHETERDLSYLKIELKATEKKIQAKEKEIDELNILINERIQELCGDKISSESASEQESRKAETVENIKSLFEWTNSL